MNLLITGAAGFIGSRFVKECWNRGHDFVLVDDLSYGNIKNLQFLGGKLHTCFFNIDIRDAEKMNALMCEKKIDGIYNFAGIAPLPDCQSDPQKAVSINIGGFVNIIESARKNGICNIIQASTNALYENVDVYPTKEEELAPPSLVYPMTKYTCEIMAKGFCDAYDMNISCLRFANVYGPNMDFGRKKPSLIAYLVKELYEGNIPEVYSNGEQRRDYIYVDDVVDLALKSINNKGFNAINVSSCKNYSVNEIFQLLCEIMKCENKIVFNNHKQFWGNYKELNDCCVPIKDEIVVKEINKNTLCDNSKAKELLNWKPKVNMKEGLEHVVESICERCRQ